MPGRPWPFGISGDAETDGYYEWLQVAHNPDGTLRAGPPGGGGASDITNVPAGHISSTNVQAAINELDNEKAAASDLLVVDNVTVTQSGATLVVKDGGITSAKLAALTAPIELVEETDPAAPASDHALLYVRDTGGKTQLCVRFHTGAVQVIATEP